MVVFTVRKNGVTEDVPVCTDHIETVLHTIAANGFSTLSIDAMPKGHLHCKICKEEPEMRPRELKSVQRFWDKFYSACKELEELSGNVYAHKDDFQSDLAKAEFYYLLRMAENYGNGGWDVTDVFNIIKLVMIEERREGKLVFDRGRGRYCLGEGRDAHSFNCSSLIEVYLEEGLDDVGGDHDDEPGWYFGRVEYSDSFGGYYFYTHSGDKHHKLRPGMLAAIRVGRAD